MPKQPKNHEHRIEVRVFVRAKDSDSAHKFAEAVNKTVQEMAGNFLAHRVSLTGSHVEVVEDLERSYD